MNDQEKIIADNLLKRIVEADLINTSGAIADYARFLEAVETRTRLERPQPVVGTFPPYIPDPQPTTPWPGVPINPYPNIQPDYPYKWDNGPICGQLLNKQ